MKAEDTTYNHGGMMRCCIASLEEFVLAEPGCDVSPGIVVPCLYCHHGVWELDENHCWRAQPWGNTRTER